MTPCVWGRSHDRANSCAGPDPLGLADVHPPGDTLQHGLVLKEVRRDPAHLRDVLIPGYGHLLPSGNSSLSG